LQLSPVAAESAQGFVQLNVPIEHWQKPPMFGNEQLSVQVSPVAAESAQGLVMLQVSVPMLQKQPPPLFGTVHDAVHASPVAAVSEQVTGVAAQYKVPLPSGTAAPPPAPPAPRPNALQ